MKNFQKLLLGAQNAAKMRSDIKEFTSTIVGMINPGDIAADMSSEVAKLKTKTVKVGKDYEWAINTLTIIGPKKFDSTVVIEFRQCGTTTRTLFSTDPTNPREPTLKDLRRTWFALEELMELLMDIPSFSLKAQYLY
jgi:hypothetical protein